MFLWACKALPVERKDVQFSYAAISSFVRRLHYTPSRRWSTHQINYLQQQDYSKTTQGSFFNKFKSSISFPPATHEIQDLSNSSPSIREEVVLHGYLGVRVDLSKNLAFVPLLDKNLSHSIQIISTPQPSCDKINSVHENLKKLEPHTPVVVRGLLKERVPPTNKGPRHIEKIDSVEIELREVQRLNDFPREIIFTPDTVFPLEKRHLQIRSERSLRQALKFRAIAADICRDELCCKNGFLDVETPLLFKSTPEGAREFVVPTRQRGYCYALPQSPQQYKQILMGSGIANYFQFARCFRDEDLRADRQPEFTQLDLEMSFASGEDVMRRVEALIKRLWADMLTIALPSPFPRLTYQEAMGKYGSDKPDIRLGMPISRVDHLIPADLTCKISSLSNPIVEAMVFRFHTNSNPSQTRDFISGFLDSPSSTRFQENPEGGPGIFIYDSKKPLQGLMPLGFEAAERFEEMFSLVDGDLVILQARANGSFHGGFTNLGKLRLALHKDAVRKELLPPPEGFRPLWVTDFPLFSPSSSTEPGQGGNAGIASTHHPFTSPKSADDVDLLLQDPKQAIGDHYDLVINGFELGGGSRRIHQSEMQYFILNDVLRMSAKRLAEFSHLLKVLRAGCPPHAGMALGFDRLIAIMLGRETIRDVIAFPKSGKGDDPLVGSPGIMTESILQTYHLKSFGH